MLTSQRADLRTIAATVHGRFVVRQGPADRVLIGFHGYAETAEVMFDQMSKIPGTDEWSIASVQALHPFYERKTQQVVANWMTSQDRELAIADNLAYVRSVVEQLHTPRTIVFIGFSQGVAMAYRAAASIPAAGVIPLAGDVPPDARSNLPPVLLGRGIRDEWYSAEKLEKDLRFLETVTRVTPCVFDGGHEWTDEFRAAAAEFLRPLSAL